MRYWTVTEANAELPRVATLVERARGARSAVRQRAELIRERASGNGHAPPADEDTAALEEVAAELAADGIVLRDVDSGLIDFPAQSDDGREYWLCWRAGEDAVGWWHWPEDGFAGRRPISEAP